WKEARRSSQGSSCSFVSASFQVTKTLKLITSRISPTSQNEIILRLLTVAERLVPPYSTWVSSSCTQLPGPPRSSSPN
ncbi:hypothetical protein M514_00537, partial [Trichuris suis]